MHAQPFGFLLPTFSASVQVARCEKSMYVRVYIHIYIYIYIYHYVYIYIYIHILHVDAIHMVTFVIILSMCNHCVQRVSVWLVINEQQQHNIQVGWLAGWLAAWQAGCSPLRTDSRNDICLKTWLRRMSAYSAGHMLILIYSTYRTSSKHIIASTEVFLASTMSA